MIEITEDSDGELLINCAPWETEDAIRQLRAEIADYRDQFAGLCHTLSVGSEGRPGMTANDWRKRVDDGINWLTSPMIKRYESAESKLTRLQMLAEHLVREPGIDAGRAIVVQSERIAELTAELARLRAQVLG